MSPPPATSPSTYSGLLAALHGSISGGHASDAVSLLPALARAGLRAPFPLLSSLAGLLLLRRAAPSFPSLAGRLLLYVRLAGLKKLVPCSTQLANHLLSLHLLLGRARDARRLFGRMPRPNIYSYNAMLAGYARLDLAAPAAEVFAAMPHRDLLSYNATMLALARGGEMRCAVALYSELRSRSPSLGYNHHTFSALLVACEKLVDEDLGRQLHARLVVHGFLADVKIASPLVDVYAKCGSIGDAENLFNEMPVKNVRMWTTVVCGYAELGLLAAAHRLFDQMPESNILSWNALIDGYAHHGQEVEALSIFQLLIREGVHPDQLTFISCLGACAAMCSLKHGQLIHGRLLRTGFDQNATIASSLVDMYSKCGYLAGAKQVFSLSSQKRRDTMLWNTLLSALYHHRHGQEVVGLFVQMIRERQKPDANTFLLVLLACSHCSLVEEGIGFFELMTDRYGIVPGEDHYVCMVDLVFRSSSLDKVVEWIKSTPFACSTRVWGTLVGNCRIHGNLELVNQVLEHLAELGNPK